MHTSSGPQTRSARLSWWHACTVHPLAAKRSAWLLRATHKSPDSEPAPDLHLLASLVDEDWQVREVWETALLKSDSSVHVLLGSASRFRHTSASAACSAISASRIPSSYAWQRGRDEGGGGCKGRGSANLERNSQGLTRPIRFKKCEDVSAPHLNSRHRASPKE